MDTNTTAIKPDQIIEIILRRRWLLILPFCLVMVVGIFLAVMLPKTYEAGALILVEAQRVPEDYVQSVVSNDFDARINNIVQQILSRTNLEKIISDLRLYSGPEYAGMFAEDKVQSLRSRITVDVTQSRRRRVTDSFSISFKGKDPDEVVKVVNTLTEYFINENLRSREAQAVGTSSFLEGELNSIREKLELVEEEMKEYRRRYMGELPEQLESNLRMLDRVEEQIIDANARLGEAKNRLSDFRNRMTTENPLSAGSTNGASTGQQTSSLGQLEDQLARLQVKYTDQHPDIMRLKKTIRELKTDMMAEPSIGSGGNVGASARLSSSDNRQYNEMMRDIAGIQKDITDLLAQRKMYTRRVENTPKREQELMSLRRDYSNIQESYNSMLNRKLEAEISVNMEKKQKGERFRVIDPARRPEKPVEPDMERLFLIVLAAGLGIGGGISFLLERMNASFRRSEEVESVLGIPVIATIPSINHPKDIFMQRANSVATVVCVLLSLVLFLSFSLVVFKGPDGILALINKFA